MGGKGSGNRTMSNPAVAKRAENVDPDANAKVIAYAKRLWRLPQVDMSDPVAVEERVDLFFDTCAECGMRPLVGNLAASFGMSQPTFSSLMAGSVEGKKWGVTPEVLLILKKSYAYVNAIFEQTMLDAKNPVPFIYYTKAQLDWREAPTETVIRHESSTPRLEGGTREEIAAKYAEIVGVEDVRELPSGEQEEEA